MMHWPSDTPSFNTPLQRGMFAASTEPFGLSSDCSPPFSIATYRLAQYHVARWQLPRRKDIQSHALLLAHCVSERRCCLFVCRDPDSCPMLHGIFSANISWMKIPSMLKTSDPKLFHFNISGKLVFGEARTGACVLCSKPPFDLSMQFLLGRYKIHYILQRGAGMCDGNIRDSRNLDGLKLLFHGTYCRGTGPSNKSRR